MAPFLLLLSRPHPFFQYTNESLFITSPGGDSGKGLFP